MSESEQKQSVVSSLYAQRRHHEVKIEYWKKQRNLAVGNLEKHTNQLNAIQGKLDKIVGREIYVTSHAISRYRERIDEGAKEQEIVARLLTPRMESIIRTLGSGEYHSEDGEIKFIVEDMKIVTLYKAGASKELKQQIRKRNRKLYKK